MPKHQPALVLITTWLSLLSSTGLSGGGQPTGTQPGDGGTAETAALRVLNIEVVTVTDTTAAITWETDAPERGAVRFGSDPGDLDQIVVAKAPARRHHQCRLTGLHPGTKYYFACTAAERQAPASSKGQSFATLVPPPGRELFTFASMTDTHVGQQVVGRVVLSGGRVLFPGVGWREPQVPIWQVALEPAISEINVTDCAFTVIKGDLTHGLEPGEFRLASKLFGALKQPVRPVRGNHDDLGLYLRTFHLPRQWYSFDHAGFHFVVLDTELLLGSASRSREDQFRWLATDLGKSRDRWTFVFLHRPIEPKLARSDDEVSDRAVQLTSGLLRKVAGPTAARALQFATGRLQDVPEAQARRMAELFARHGRVAGVFAGHVHRNFVGYWPEQTGNLPFVETASASEYPCGYAITRVFEGGYMQSYYVPDDTRCLEWSALTRAAFRSMGLESKAGSVAERNFVVTFGKLDLKAGKGR